MKLQSIRQLSYYVSIAAALASCGSELPGNESITSGETEVSVRFNIAAATPGSPTRADGDPEALPNELIDSWWVAFVDSDNKIAAVCKHEPNATEDNFVEEKGSVVLPIGTYTIYAFGNYSSTALPNDFKTTLDGLERGTSWSGSNLSAIHFDASYSDQNLLIPMSRKMTMTVSAGQTNSVDIELIRMLAKVEFEITNGTGKDLYVTGLKFGRLYSGNVDLFPTFDTNNNPTLSTSFEGTIKDDNDFLTGSDKISFSKDQETASLKHFYIRETKCKPTEDGTGTFEIRLNVDRKGGVLEEQLYSTSFQYGPDDGKVTLTEIHRNDYILIPIKLTDWDLTFDAKTVVPIAGYEPKVITKGNYEYEIAFGISGEFTITPKLMQGNTEQSGLINISDITIEDSKSENQAVTETDDANILKNLPGKDSKISYSGNHFTGILTDVPRTDGKPRSGTAVLTFDLKAAPTNATERTYKCKINIIRK